MKALSLAAHEGLLDKKEGIGQIVETMKSSFSGHLVQPAVEESQRTPLTTTTEKPLVGGWESRHQLAFPPAPPVWLAFARYGWDSHLRLLSMGKGCVSRPCSMGFPRSAAIPPFEPLGRGKWPGDNGTGSACSRRTLTSSSLVQGPPRPCANRRALGFEGEALEDKGCRR